MKSQQLTTTKIQIRYFILIDLPFKIKFVINIERAFNGLFLKLSIILIQQ